MREKARAVCFIRYKNGMEQREMKNPMHHVRWVAVVELTTQQASTTTLDNLVNFRLLLLDA